MSETLRSIGEEIVNLPYRVALHLQEPQIQQLVTKTTEAEEERKHTNHLEQQLASINGRSQQRKRNAENEAAANRIKTYLDLQSRGSRFGVYGTQDLSVGSGTETNFFYKRGHIGLDWYWEHCSGKVTSTEVYWNETTGDSEYVVDASDILKEAEKRNVVPAESIILHPEFAEIIWEMGGRRKK